MIGDESDRNIYNKREQINFPNAYIFWMYMREGDISSAKKVIQDMNSLWLREVKKKYVSMEFCAWQVI